MKHEEPVTSEPTHDRLYTVPEAAEYLRVSRSTMYDLIHQQNLPVVQLTTRKQLRRSTLERLIAERTVHGGWS